MVRTLTGLPIKTTKKPYETVFEIDFKRLPLNNSNINISNLNNIQLNNSSNNSNLSVITNEYLSIICGTLQLEL